VVHPIVRTHPGSWRKATYINPIRTEGLLGLAEEEALAFLAELIEHATQPKYEYRYQWRPGDLVIWDNRSLLHKANGDYDMDQVRYSTAHAEGDRPV
jgi:taurine dioxygenase